MRLCNQYVPDVQRVSACMSHYREPLPQMNDGQSTTHPEPDPAPFKVHLLTRAGRVMRARSEPVRAFSNKDEAVRFACAVGRNSKQPSKLRLHSGLAVKSEPVERENALSRALVNIVMLP